jgi:hypothetical protein
MQGFGRSFEKEGFWEFVGGGMIGEEPWFEGA